jgi:murein DD-endopeptidase MepM/ murein hydrolase activator NlpD
MLSGCGEKTESAPPQNPDGLTFPVACTLGEDCWIARYVDHGQGAEARDYLCGTHTQSGHKGTDIAVNDLGRMAAGVDVLAAKGGTVLRLRDGVDDISVRRTGADAVDGQECGNGIVIAHDNGDESQYCHLRKGSITVKPDERVEAGAKIAQIGLSGETEFPHLHYMLRRGGEIIDPFDGSHMSDHCDASGPILWASDIAYDPLILFDLQLSEAPPKGDTVWQPGKSTLDRMSPAMVVTARGMFTETGDTWHMRIRDPKGKVFVEKEAALEDGDQFYYRFIGRKRPDSGFMPGIWTGELTAKRGTEAEKKLKLEFRVE